MNFSLTAENLRQFFLEKDKNYVPTKEDKVFFRDNRLEYFTKGNGFWILRDLQSEKLIKVQIPNGNESRRNLHIAFYCHKILELIDPILFQGESTILFGFPSILIQEEIPQAEVVSEDIIEIHKTDTEIFKKIRALGALGIVLDLNPDNFIKTSEGHKYVDLVKQVFIKSEADIESLCDKLIKDRYEWFEKDEEQRKTRINEIRKYGQKILKLAQGKENPFQGTVTKSDY